MDNPAAWHPDPTGRHEHRWWDGQRWTEHVADAGQASIDPIEGGSTAQDAGTAAGGTGAAQGGTASQEPRSTETTAEHTGPSWEQPGGTQQDAGWSQPGGTQHDAGWSQPGGGQPGGGQPGAGQPAWGQPQAGGQQWQPQQQWPQAAPTGQAPATGTSGLAIFALILGILSLLFFWVPVLGGLGAVIAIVLGLIGRSSARKQGTSGAGLGIAGAITGAVALLLNVLVTMFLFGLFGTSMNFFGLMSDYVECMEEHDDEELCERELEDSVWNWLSD